MPSVHRFGTLIEPSAGLVAPLLYLGLKAAGLHPVVLNGQQRTVDYQYVGGAAIGLLAFGITPAVILFALAPGERLKAIMRHHGGELRWTIARSLWLLLGLLVVVGLALSFDQSDPGTSWVRYLTLALAASTLAAVVRLLLVFTALMGVIDKDRLDDRKPLPKVEHRQRQAG